MNEQCKALLLALDEQLKFISLETDNQLTKAELSIDIAQKIIAELKAFITKYKFRSVAEEIKFFKDIKPLFASKLFYHIAIYNIETRKPQGGYKVIKKYLQNELDKLKRYFDNNLDFYKYYRTGSNYLDHKYFVRGKHDIRFSLETFFFETDAKFSTSHDYKISMILANDQLQVYLEDELAELEKKEPKLKSQDVPKSKITWIESKTALIELIYSLQSQGAFGNQTDIKDIAECFQEVFNIELGDYYRTYLEIRIRKTGRTKFLQGLQESLIKRMDEQDEK